MKIIHKGFDKLEVAFEGQISAEFDAMLSEAKAYSAQHRHKTNIEFNGVAFLVSESGARGGYSYTCDTGPFGAIWFFKRPSSRDPWGIRVSVKSLPLATFGLGWARHYIDDTLENLGVAISHEKMGISRVDYAVDILAPDFRLRKKYFVYHSRSKHKTHNDIEHIGEVGHSGRTTSVTVGKNPGRQVIIYDKREEALTDAEKVVWWEIWNANLAKMGLPPLERADPSKSRVWRVEFRVYKRHLKDDWNVRTWADLDDSLHDVISSLSQDIRYTQPTKDSNRARWPNHAIWDIATIEAVDDLSEMLSEVPIENLKSVMADKHKQTLLSLFLGLGVSMAGLEGIRQDGFEAFLDKITYEAKKVSRSHKVPLKKRIEKSAGRYAFIRRTHATE